MKEWINMDDELPNYYENVNIKVTDRKRKIKDKVF